MNKYIALILGLAALITTSCYPTHCTSAALNTTTCSPIHYISASPHVAGDWKMGGPYNIGLPCLILQSDNYLTFVNEKGDRSRGVLKNRSEVIALDWEGGLPGTLTNNSRRINWKNGTWWIKQ
jgi:hypothetical protein